MAKCAYCGSSIIFGGKQVDKYHFCNDNCAEYGYVLQVSDQIPPELLAEQIVEVHQGDCPSCGKPGPVDVHTSHTIWSLIILSSWKSEPAVCCGSCGKKKKVGALLFSFFFGWWGFPWGILLTPIQVGRNFIGLFTQANPSLPSAELENIVKVHLAARLIEQHQAQQQAEQGAPPQL